MNETHFSFLIIHFLFLIFETIHHSSKYFLNMYIILISLSVCKLTSLHYVVGCIIERKNKGVNSKHVAVRILFYLYIVVSRFTFHTFVSKFLFSAHNNKISAVTMATVTSVYENISIPNFYFNHLFYVQVLNSVNRNVLL